jgi:hypothetical protein
VWVVVPSFFIKTPILSTTTFDSSLIVTPLNLQLNCYLRLRILILLIVCRVCAPSRSSLISKMLAAGKSSLVSRIQSHGRVASSLMIGSVRTLIVPHGAGSRQKISQKVSAATIRRRIGGTPKIDITTSAMPLSPKGAIIVESIFCRYEAARNMETGYLYEDITMFFLSHHNFKSMLLFAFFSPLVSSHSLILNMQNLSCRYQNLTICRW